MSINSFESMLGVTMRTVVSTGDELIFTSMEGKKFTFYHSQDCCESVSIEDIIGDLSDLEGSPIVEAEEISSDNEPPPGLNSESYTWTFYRFSTGKGTVTVRWLGQSSGYYSEGVSFSIS